MSEFAISEDQQLKLAYHEMVAQSRVIKQRNLHLERMQGENQQKIKSYVHEKNEQNDYWKTYQR